MTTRASTRVQNRDISPINLSLENKNVPTAIKLSGHFVPKAQHWISLSPSLLGYVDSGCTVFFSLMIEVCGVVIEF